MIRDCALENENCSIWNRNDLARIRLPEVDEAICESKYVVVLWTASCLQHRDAELNAIQAITQAVYTRTPRFLPIRRDNARLPLYIEVFVGLDMR
jgi:hypothetical protein